MSRLPFIALVWLGACGGTSDFECGGKALEIVPLSAVCDGVIDCWGGQDERADGCATELASCDQPEPRAVLASQVCDGIDDCGDASEGATSSDEIGCN